MLMRLVRSNMVLTKGSLSTIERTNFRWIVVLGKDHNDGATRERRNRPRRPLRKLPSRSLLTSLFPPATHLSRRRAADRNRAAWKRIRLTHLES